MCFPNSEKTGEEACMKGLLYNIKNKWKCYLERLAKTNRELYGSGRLDCCDLNRQHKPEHNK